VPTWGHATRMSVDSPDGSAARRPPIKRALRRIDAYGQRHAWFAFPYGAIKKFGEDKGGYLSALIAYYGFFSLFPLLLVFVTVLGYLLSGDPDLQRRIVNSTFTQFPVIGTEISENVGTLDGNLFALIFGSLAALWAGLGALRAMEHAMNTVWGVPIKRRPNFLMSRLRALVMLGVFGGGILGIIVLGAAGTATASFGLAAKVLSALLACGLAIAIFLLAFRVLTHCDLPWRAHLPGAVVGGVLFVALQVVGGFYVNHVVKGARDTYGAFAVVIGLLSWMYLQAQIAVLAAEVNVVRHNHLWPRSMPGGTLTEADRRTLEQDAEMEERVDGEDVETDFRPVAQT
jgi:YihY family inner membrane protein